jgi:branched-chain amino acid transport system permease protein
VNLAQVLNGISLGALLMIVSSGLAMIYGLRGVMNFSHGALYMVGAYVAYAVTTRTTFWFALAVAPLALAAVGALLELGILRRVTRRSPIEVALITFGLALLVERTVVLVWGSNTHPVPAPSALSGTVSFLGTSYPAYRLVVIGITLLVAAALILWLRRSRTGLHIRASSHDTETSAVLGVNVDRMSLIVVCVGAALAGLAGTLAAPFVSASPGMDTTILINALIVVVVGGLGSIEGAMAIGLALGLLQIMGNVWLPSVASLVPYALLISILLWRPQGLAGKRLQ